MSDPVIIGGGPAGAAAAILLARAGRAVTLIERNAVATDKVCGDFVSAEAVEAITALGVDLPALAPSQIDAVRLVHGRRVAHMRMPFTALGLTRRALDEALLQQAKVSGATILRGHAARRIERTGGSLLLDCGSPGRISAETVFLATGKHDLRGATRTGHTDLVGMKMYYMLDPREQAALRHCVELILFSGGYAGLQLVEANQAVLCVLVSRARLRAADGRWDNLLDGLIHECPHLAGRLAGARALLARPAAIAGLPYGYNHAPAAHAPPGLFRLGDQAAVIASLTGDGVALALATAASAARTWLEHGNIAAAHHRRLAARLARQMRVASAVHRICLSPGAQPWLLRACRRWPMLGHLAALQTRAPGGL